MLTYVWVWVRDYTEGALRHRPIVVYTIYIFKSHVLVTSDINQIIIKNGFTGKAGYQYYKIALALWSSNSHVKYVVVSCLRTSYIM